jgi:hypothetical protein
MHTELPAVSAPKQSNQFPDTIYVQIDEDAVDGQEEIFAERDHRDLAQVDTEMLIGVYRLDHVATLTTTVTLRPYPEPRNGPSR